MPGRQLLFCRKNNQKLVVEKLSFAELVSSVYIALLIQNFTRRHDLLMYSYPVFVVFPTIGEIVALDFSYSVRNEVQHIYYAIENPCAVKCSQYIGYDFSTTCGSSMCIFSNTKANGANAIAIR